MAWRNVISKNADQARSPQKSYENYHGKSPHSMLRAVDRMFISRGSNRKNDKCKLIAWFELLFDFETMSSVCNFCCPSLFCYTKIGFNFLLALFSHNNFFPRLPLQHVWVKSCMWTTCGYHLPLRFLLNFSARWSVGKLARFHPNMIAHTSFFAHAMSKLLWQSPGNCSDITEWSHTKKVKKSSVNILDIVSARRSPHHQRFIN